MASSVQKSLKEVMKDINKKFDSDKPALQLGVSDIRDHGVLSIGSPGLDYCFYGGLPTRRFIEISGKEGSGKTSLAFMLCASYQRMEIEKENPRGILFVDLECSADPDWADKMGFDMSEDASVPVYAFRPLDTPAEEILTYVRDIIKTGEIGLVVLDSIPLLVGQQIYGESFEKKEMAGISKTLTAFVAQTTSLLVKYDCTFIGINQLRDNIGGYGLPYTTPGGQAWKYACSARLMVKKGAFLDEDGNSLTSSAESPAGYEMEMAVLKIKSSKWDRKLGRTTLSYTKGIDYIQDTIDVAIHLGLIDNSTQGSFKLLNPDTGEILLDEDGNEIKVRGKKNVKPYFEEHKDIWKKLYDKIYEKISQKDDPFISAFEEMMRSEISESIGIDVNADSIEEM